jgi:hypothetical protein
MKSQTEIDAQPPEIRMPQISLSLARVRLLLFYLVSFITGLSVIGSLIAIATRGPWAPLNIQIFGNNIFQLLFLGFEFNIPTWYASVSLAACAGLVAFAAYVTRYKGGKFASHFWWLVALLMLFSLDEFIGLHELIGKILQNAFHFQGFLSYPWVIVGLVAVVIFCVLYRPLFLSLHRKTRIIILISIVLAITGAIGFEMLEAAYESYYAIDRWPYEAMIYIEEIMEMASAAVFAYAVLVYIRDCLDDAPLIITIRD